MRLPERLMTWGGVFVAGGLAIWAMAWIIDLSVHLQRVAVDPGGHSHGGGDVFIRINFPLTGLPLILAGMGGMIGFDRLLNGRGVFLTFCAGVLFAVDGLAHAFAFNDHLNDPLSAALFAFAAPAQILIGVSLPFLSRRYDPLWLLAALGLMAAYVVSRTAYVPALNMPEAVEGLGMFSKFLEFAFVVLVLLNLRNTGAPNAPAAAVAPQGGSSEPQPR